MTTLGRIGVTVLVAGVLIALTVAAAYWLKSPEPSAGVPQPPAVVETPETTEELGDAGSSQAQEPEGRASSEPAEAPAPSGTPTQPLPAGTGDAAADEGLAMMSDRPVLAQKRLSEALRAGVGGARAAKVREALGQLADRIQFAGHRVPADPHSKAYRAQPGDMLVRIGRRFLVPYELIMRVNGLTTPGIQAGQTLKVIQGPIHVEVLKGPRELQAWLGEVCLRVYPVGLGQNNGTPEGTFVVKSKLQNPPYQPQHKPKSEFRDGGAPDNPLGSRWIDIGNHYGIHGTIEPESIGKAVSEGCIRMHNKDVEELYDLLVVGASKVTVRP